MSAQSLPTALPLPVLADLGLRARVAGSPLPRTAVDALLVGGAAGLTGLLAQVAVPLWFTPVPLTLQTLAAVLVGATLGPLRALAAMTLYLAVGAAGFPWFAGGESGTAAPSFGYVVGFVLGAVVVGVLARRGWDRSPWRAAGAMVLGNLAIYAVGVPWLALALGVDLATAADLGLVPFLGGDALKIAVAAGLLPASWWLVGRLGGSRPSER